METFSDAEVDFAISDGDHIEDEYVNVNRNNQNNQNNQNRKSAFDIQKRLEEADLYFHEYDDDDDEEYDEYEVIFDECIESEKNYGNGRHGYETEYETEYEDKEGEKQCVGLNFSTVKHFTGIKQRWFHTDIIEKIGQGYPAENSSILHIVDVRPDGNCLFYCYSSILSQITSSDTPQVLRNMVSENVTEEQFYHIIGLYIFARKENDTDLLRDLCHLDGITSLRDFKRVLKTPKYFGDELAVQIIDEVYETRTIIAVRTSENVVSINNTWKMHNDAKRNTSLYCILLLDALSQHYKFIMFNQKTLMTFEQLPLDIQNSFQVLKK